MGSIVVPSWAYLIWDPKLYKPHKRELLRSPMGRYTHELFAWGSLNREEPLFFMTLAAAEGRENHDHHRDGEGLESSRLRVWGFRGFGV